MSGADGELLGSSSGFGGRLGHDRSPETPKGPDGPLCGEMDRFWQQARSLAGGYLGLMTVVLLAIQSLRGLIASHYKFYRAFVTSSNAIILDLYS